MFDRLRLYLGLRMPLPDSMDIIEALGLLNSLFVLYYIVFVHGILFYLVVYIWICFNFLLCSGDVFEMVILVGRTFHKLTFLFWVLRQCSVLRRQLKNDGQNGLWPTVAINVPKVNTMVAIHDDYSDFLFIFDYVLVGFF